MESDVFGDASKRPAVESPPAVRTENNHLRLPPLRFFQNFPPIAVARDRSLRRCFEAGLLEDGHTGVCVTLRILERRGIQL